MYAGPPSSEDLFGRIFPIEVKKDPIACIDWWWENSVGGWIRNWGLFVERDGKPHLVRMSSLCSAKGFANDAEEIDQVSSTYEKDLSFYGGNFREVSQKEMIIGHAGKEEENLAQYLTDRWVDV